MSEFFRSDVVRKTVVELSQMQERLMMEMPQLQYLPPDKKKEHLKFLKAFLEKQKLFFFRMSLVEDEEVKMIKEKLIANRHNQNSGIPLLLDSNYLKT